MTQDQNQSEKTSQDADELSALATRHYTGEDCEIDYKKAWVLYEQAASMGSIWSHYMLGVMSQKGQGVEKNAKKAVEHYQTAADAQHPLSVFNIGVIYQVGFKGQIESDLKKAAQYYELGAELGHAQSAYNLGAVLHAGLNGSPDLIEAYNWYRKAASLGHEKGNQMAKTLMSYADPKASARAAVQAFRKKPASLWDRLIGRR